MRIVVGVSLDTDDGAAVDWAMEMARGREATVDFVHVVDITWGHAPEVFIEEALMVAEEKLRDLARSVHERMPGIAVHSRARAGSPVNDLVAVAEGADYLVIGAHPDQHAGGAGRRAVRIARLAPCSVIVVPVRAAGAGKGVIVGVDGSVESDLAVEFAAELADRLGEPLTVLMSAGQPDGWAPLEPNGVAATDEDRLIVAESIAGVAQRYPDLDVHTQISEARPERALYGASLESRMLVVGSHGRNALERALLGSTSEAMVADLPCAVAVIRRAKTTETSVLQ